MSSITNQCITITNALPQDMPDITEVSVAAFTTFDIFGPPWNSDAGLLPAVLTALPGATPEDSRIARIDGRIIGHAQWIRGQMYLAGQVRPVAYLAPLSVHPDWQHHGVGSLLVQDGISLMKSQGVSLLFLLGHDAYYPRFGFLGNCHGKHALSVALPPALSQDADGWVLRPLKWADGPDLLALWQSLSGKVDGALFPGTGLVPWCAKTKGITACVLEKQGQLQAYARVDLRAESTAESRLLRFLAINPEAADILLGRLRAWGNWQEPEIVVPLSLTSSRVALLFADAQPFYQRFSAGMALPLTDDQAVHTLVSKIRAETAPPLFIEWSNLFDW